MLTFSNQDLKTRIRTELGADAGAIDFLPFSNLEASVLEDVRLLADSPLLEANTPVRGFVYDVRTGRLTEVGVPAVAAPGV
jgi:carbonic anhydrase